MDTNYWQHISAPWGGMFSTVDDLSRLLAVTLDDGVLKDARPLYAGTNRAMISNRTVAIPGLCDEHQRLPLGAGVSDGRGKMRRKAPSHMAALPGP